MAYADADYYKSTYQGTEIPEGELSSLLSRASDDVDSMTFHRIGGNAGFMALTPFQQGQVKKAVCAQADYLHDFGDAAALGLSGYSVGDVSVSMGNGSGGTVYSPQARRLLLPTGLLNRGVYG